MTIADQLNDLVHDAECSKLQKAMMTGFIERAKNDETKNQEDRALIEQVANEKKLLRVIFSTDEVKIYTITGKQEWDIKYPYRSIYLGKNGTWQRTSIVSPNFDLAFLAYMQNKHLGQNSQFLDFVVKMLEIKLEE